MPRIVLLLEGKTAGLSSTYEIEEGGEARIGIYAREEGESLNGAQITISEITPGAPNPVYKLDESTPSHLFRGSVVLQASRPELSGEGFGVYVERSLPFR